MIIRRKTKNFSIVSKIVKKAVGKYNSKLQKSYDKLVDKLEKGKTPLTKSEKTLVGKLHKDMKDNNIVKPTENTRLETAAKNIARKGNNFNPQAYQGSTRDNTRSGIATSRMLDKKKTEELIDDRLEQAYANKEALLRFFPEKYKEITDSKTINLTKKLANEEKALLSAPAGINKNDPATLAHEIGHQKYTEGSILGRWSSDKYDYIPERSGGIKSSIKNAIYGIPKLIQERGASKEGLKLLKKNGATKEELKKAKERLKTAYGTYKNLYKRDILAPLLG